MDALSPEYAPYLRLVSKAVSCFVVCPLAQAVVTRMGKTLTTVVHVTGVVGW